MEPKRWRHSSDADLVLAATLGEISAFDELARRFRPAVWTVARQVAGPEAADDVTQDALLLAFKALPQLDDPERFGSWLYAVTRNRALRFKQSPEERASARRSHLDLLLLEQAPEIGPAQSVERAERRAEVRAALERLPEEFQTVLQLRYFEHVPVARIAEFLGVPVTTVKWRLHRGRQQMRQELERCWMEPPPGRPGGSKNETRRDGERGGARAAGGDPAPGPDARRDRPRLQGCEPDGPARGREGRRDPAVQRDPRATLGACGASGGRLRAAAGGCVV